MQKTNQSEFLFISVKVIMLNNKKKTDEKEQIQLMPLNNYTKRQFKKEKTNLLPQHLNSERAEVTL